jgi:hypothetical protein
MVPAVSVFSILVIAVYDPMVSPVVTHTGPDFRDDCGRMILTAACWSAVLVFASDETSLGRPEPDSVRQRMHSEESARPLPPQW